MPNHRRYRMPEVPTFTVNLLERRQDTMVHHIDILCGAVRKTRSERPFHSDSWAVLSDHMHTVWTLPPCDDDFSNRWKSIKIRFVQAIPQTERRSKVRIAKGERGVWQRRFWEHVICDEADYEHHVNYVHWNPVKHGLVKKWLIGLFLHSIATSRPEYYRLTGSVILKTKGDNFHHMSLERA